MSYVYVTEDRATDIGKLLKLKASSFVSIEAEPGEFFMKGKKLFFDAPAIEFGDEYLASVSITYLNKKGKEVTSDYEVVIQNTDGVVSVVKGDDGPNTLALGGKKPLLIYGHDGNDRIGGSTASDKIYGGDGDDEISAGKGNDQIMGGDGDDQLWGAEGNDLIDGGDGDDTIYSWTGTDTLTGGAGSDNFAFETDGGADVITDFEPGVDDIYYNGDYVSEASFAAIATKTATGTLLTFDSTASVLLEGVFL